MGLQIYWTKIAMSQDSPNTHPTRNADCHLTHHILTFAMYSIVLLHILYETLLFYALSSQIIIDFHAFFQHFREDYCRFDWDLIVNTEASKNVSQCQSSCQNHEHCNFFVYHKDDEVCKLHCLNYASRVCDIIHGPPFPSFQSCLDEGEIPWNSSGNVTNLIQKPPSFYLFLYL